MPEKQITRISMPTRLRLLSISPYVLGRGGMGTVVLGYNRNFDSRAIKIPHYADENSVQEFDFCFGKAAYNYLNDYLGKGQYVPIVKPLDITKCYTSDKLVFSMPKMDKKLSELRIENKQDYQKALKHILKIKKILNRAGFVLNDIHDTNILLKDGKPYITDFGDCSIRFGSVAAEYYNQIASKYNFRKNRKHTDKLINSSMQTTKKTILLP